MFDLSADEAGRQATATPASLLISLIRNDNEAAFAECASLLRPYIARHVPRDQVDDFLQETIETVGRLAI